MHLLSARKVSDMADFNKGATTEAPAKQTQVWPVIGKLWATKKPGIFTGAIGIISKGTRNFENVTLKHGERIALRTNKKRDGKRDADFQICIIPSDAV